MLRFKARQYMFSVHKKLNILYGDLTIQTYSITILEDDKINMSVSLSNVLHYEAIGPM